MKWLKSNQITCIHRLSNSFIDCVMFDILVYKKVVHFNILNDHEHAPYHGPLTLSLNFVMHKSLTQENYDSQKHLIFDKDKIDFFNGIK